MNAGHVSVYGGQGCRVRKVSLKVRESVFVCMKMHKYNMCELGLSVFFQVNTSSVKQLLQH